MHSLVELTLRRARSRSGRAEIARIAMPELLDVDSDWQPVLFENSDSKLSTALRCAGRTAEKSLSNCNWVESVES